MKYKDLNNNVHDIVAGFEYLLPSGSVSITDAQATVLLIPTPETPQEANSRKDAQVEAELGTDSLRVVMSTLLGLINPLLNVTEIIEQAKAARRAEL